VCEILFTMKVSIITVTYNSSSFLEDCIKSVIMQDYPEIEHLIIDGKSTDSTLDIVSKYRNHIANLISESDNGMYHAINKGISIATGDIIGILNSDDMLASSNVISSIVNTFKSKNVDSVFGDLAYVDQQNVFKVIRYWECSEYNRSKFMHGWMPAHPTFYVRRQLITELGGYESHYKTAADYEFMSRLLYKFRVSSYHIPQLLVRMRIGGISNKSLKARLRANRRDYLAMKTNKIPFPLLVSVLKPLSKVPQYFYKKSQKYS